MERQQKAYKGVIDYFKKKIMDGELRPGEKLPPERDIAERLNVSRNSVREAIRIMDMWLSAYLVAMPNTPVSQHHSTAPGPPMNTAVPTPMMLPVPMVDASAVVSA